MKTKTLLILFSILLFQSSCTERSDLYHDKSTPRIDIGLIRSVKIIDTQTFLNPIKAIVTCDKMVVTICSQSVPIDVHAYIWSEANGIRYFFAEGMPEKVMMMK